MMTSAKAEVARYSVGQKILVDGHDLGDVGNAVLRQARGLAGDDYVSLVITISEMVAAPSAIESPHPPAGVQQPPGAADSPPPCL
jgi:mRNA degradation ribonuclease J1/J2